MSQGTRDTWEPSTDEEKGSVLGGYIETDLDGISSAMVAPSLQGLYDGMYKNANFKGTVARCKSMALKLADLRRTLDVAEERFTKAETEVKVMDKLIDKLLGRIENNEY